MSEVSMYRNNRDTKGENLCTVAEIYEYIRRGDWEKYTTPLRIIDPVKNEKEYKAQKNKFPAFTLSGVFPEHQRNDASIVSFTGKIAIDIDKLGDNVYDIKESLKEDPYSEAVFLSAGGYGLVVVVKINPNDFLDSFLQLEQYYKNEYGIEIDTSCKNPSRLRYVTSDPDIFVNWDSRIFEVEKLQFPDQTDFLPQNYLAPQQSESTWTPEDEIEKRCVNKILESTDGHIHEEVMKASNLAGGYIAGMNMSETRLKEAMLNAVFQRSSNPQSRSWEAKQIQDGINKGKQTPTTELLVRDQDLYSNKSPKAIEALKQVFAQAIAIHKEGRKYTSLDVEMLANEYDRIPDIAITDVAKVFEHIAKNKKKYFAWDKKSNIEKTEIHITDRWDLRYNVVRNAVDFKKKSDNAFDQLKIENLYRNLQHSRIKYNMADLKTLMNSDFVTDYDPFKHYFNNLPEWNKYDYIGQLASHIKVQDQLYFTEMFKKHLVRAVRCALGEGVNRYVFTIAGEKQSTGKTFFFRWLCPFKNDYYTEASIDSKNKDTKIATAKNFMYNIDELASLKRNDIDSLKSLISLQKINERLPYRPDAATLLRRASFYASTNNLDFLVDIENTRWLVFEVREIIRDYSSTMNVNDIWTQAFALYKDPMYNDQLTNEEAEKQGISNKDFDASSVEDEAIRKYFKVCLWSEGDFYTTLDIMQQLTLKYPLQKFSKIGIGKAMKRMGFKADRKIVNGNRVRGFYAKMIQGEYQTEKNVNELFDDKEKPF